MSESGKPAWPTPGAFPFMPFPIPGWPGSTPPPAPAPTTAAAGFDLLKNLWSQLPGSTQVPGFLVPTVDVDEIDKRIADLRAAESWIEVNLNMLRATIQGLEVQRHTIAALQSLSAMPAAAAQAARTSSAPEPRREPTPEPRSPSPEPQGEVRPPAPAALANDAAPSSAPLAGMAASNWLGYLQDQFTKVAQAAMAGSTAVTDRSASAPVGAKKATTGAPPPRTTTTRRKPAAKRRKGPAAPG